MSGIYVHIPFCRTHCTYCGFYSELLPCRRGSEAVSDGVPDRFLDALCREIGMWTGEKTESPTLYVGGGTPSLLPPRHLSRMADVIRGACVTAGDFREFTVEVNPDDIVRGGLEYASGLRRAGVDRVSMGVQSFEDDILRKMGRRHRSDDVFKAFHILRTAGFGNISIDLIFGFSPFLDMERIYAGWQAFDGIPEHVSCYQLSIEPGSGLEKMIDRGLYSIPDDDACAQQYADLCSMLASMGYEHYEISNWALPGRQSKHNSSYWDHTPYAGFGPGAHSLYKSAASDGTPVYSRLWNNPDLKSYIEAATRGSFNDVRGGETLSREQLMQERIMLGLRTARGIPRTLADDPCLVPSQVDGNVRIPQEQWFISDSIILKILERYDK